MAVPSTIQELLELVRKSEVVSPERVDEYVKQLDPLPEDPYKLAKLMVRDGIVTNFQGKQFLKGKWRGFTIGKYRVLEQLGEGGSAGVYLCAHLLMRRLVALKVLPSSKTKDPAFLERFYREARAIAALDHPNIVRAFD